MQRAGLRGSLTWVLLGGWAFLSQCEGARLEGLARGQGAVGQRQVDTRWAAKQAQEAQQDKQARSVSVEGDGELKYFLETKGAPKPPANPLLFMADQQGKKQGGDNVVDSLMSKLSLEEKIGQMTQIAVGAIWDADAGKLDEAKAQELFSKHYIGSIFDNPYGAQKKGLLDAKAWRTLIGSIQSLGKKAGLKVPLVYGLDSIHGASYVHKATLFPQQINLAAALNVSLAAIMGTVTAQDSAAAGVHWVFSPVLCLASQPLWARVWETFGEDPYIIGALGTSYIQAIQAYRGPGQARVAATMKHFIAYSHPRTGHDRSTASLDARTVRQYYLPPFRAAVSEGGVLSAMESYGDVAGVPLAANKELFDALRLDLGFPGLVVTDYDEVANLANFHKTAKNHSEAVRQAMTHTSIDMSMAPASPAFATDLLSLVKQGLISQDRVDASCRRVLEFKNALGLLNKDGPPEAPKDIEVGSAADWDAALEAARQSITLLKNDKNTLPLIGAKNILVVGPTANSLTYQTGGWSLHWQGAAEEADLATAYPKATTILQGLKAEAAGVEVTYALGTDIDGNPDPNMTREALVGLASTADAIVLCLGEESYTEKPGDIDDLALPWGQAQLANDLLATGKPVVLVLVEGRPRLLHGLDKTVPAIVHAYLPGPVGGRAVAEVLLGKVNPSGRLPYTYPSQQAALVTYWDAPSQLCVDAKGGYVRCPVAFDFGTGLSYTTFAYSEVASSRWEVTEDDTFHVSLKVTNTGKVSGAHSVLLFMSQLSRSVVPEWRLVRGFQKVSLKAGESAMVVFDVSVKQHMSYVGVSRREELESSEFFFSVGGPDKDCRNGGDGCMYVRLGTTDKYNAVCQHACRLLSSSWALGCGLGPAAKDCNTACINAAKTDSPWDWNFVNCLETQLSPHNAKGTPMCHLASSCRPLLSAAPQASKAWRVNEGAAETPSTSDKSPKKASKIDGWFSGSVTRVELAWAIAGSAIAGAVLGVVVPRAVASNRGL